MNDTFFFWQWQMDPSSRALKPIVTSELGGDSTAALKLPVRVPMEKDAEKENNDTDNKGPMLVSCDSYCQFPLTCYVVASFLVNIQCSVLARCDDISWPDQRG